jgi:hypothetical protein
MCSVNLRCVDMKAAATRLTLGALFASAMLPAAVAQTYTTFDPPGSILTVPESINNLGDVTGYYADSSNVYHGFLRTANGTITTFNPPGSTETIAYGINSSGEITGYANINGYYQGFLRTSDGTFTMINLPNFTNIMPTSINSYGDIAGVAYTTSPDYYGFIRTSGGTVTTFGVTSPIDNPLIVRISINDTDDVAGTTFYHDRYVGYVKPNGGAITTFRVPLDLYTYASGINDSGTIAGYAYDPGCGFVTCQTEVGFVRTSDGALTRFQANGKDTFTAGINASGEVTGSYSTSPVHGFLRDTSGVITTIDPPGSTGTFLTSISDSGAITGFFVDGSGSHGFILTP